LIDFHAEVTCLALKLCILTLLVFDLLLKLPLLSGICLQPVGRVLLQLPDLVFKSLFVILILLLVLALDDLLGLLGYTVKLDVKGTGSVIIDFKSLALNNVLDLLQFSLVSQDLLHFLDLLLSLLVNVVVLVLHNMLINQDSILVVSGNWKLRHFDLTLLHERHRFEVELEFLLTISGLLVAHVGVFELLDERLLLTFKVVDKVTKVAKTLRVLLLK